ncbi:unnamed protein product [Penicillium camemberti]|uniref:Str. FM013 n=1 Tax=Penicillium camemberti (strain FM 013) TaxID=1429867 RepID=A0A0G4PPS2_PENC3|nr:unnamed protein product [Penicillium camemberti]
MYICSNLIAILRTAFAERKRVNLPPRPKGKFLIGNLFDLPSPGAKEWQHWLKHKDLCGAAVSRSSLLTS